MIKYPCYTPWDAVSDMLKDAREVIEEYKAYEAKRSLEERASPYRCRA